ASIAVRVCGWSHEAGTRVGNGPDLAHGPSDPGPGRGFHRAPRLQLDSTGATKIDDAEECIADAPDRIGGPRRRTVASLRPQRLLAGALTSSFSIMSPIRSFPAIAPVSIGSTRAGAATAAAMAGFSSQMRSTAKVPAAATPMIQANVTMPNFQPRRRRTYTSTVMMRARMDDRPQPNWRAFSRRGINAYLISTDLGCDPVTIEDRPAAFQTPSCSPP